VSRISQVFASNKSLDTTLVAIVNLVRNTLDLGRCSIMLLDRERAVLTLAAAAGIPEKFWPDVRIPVGEGISGRVVYERKPVFVEDISTSEFAHAAHHERYTTRSFISVPILARGEVVGVFNANSRAERAPLRHEDLELLVAIAGFVGLAIENVRVHDLAERYDRRFHGTIDALQCGLVLVDRNLAVIAMNAEARRWLAVTPELRVEGRELLELWPELEGTTLLGRLREALANGPRATLFESLRFPRDIVAEHEIQISRVDGLDDHAQLALLTFHDVLSSAQLDTYKSRFLALLSHELRTPFTAIQAAGDLLLGVEDPCEQDDWSAMLRVVSANTRRLLTVVNSLLDVHQLENGELQLLPQQVDVDQIVSDVVRFFEADVRKKELRLELHCQPVKAEADPARLAQMVAALLDNAIKFSPSGGTVELICEPDAGNSFRISVRDFGPGIPPEMLAAEEQRFRQAELDSTRSAGGLGIGLFLTRSLAELHGGRLDLELADGGGTRATLRLPIAAV
jgi:two-component system phosphate regulon sensor histidine kinase PhoR